MTPTDLLRDQFERIRDRAVAIADDISDEDLGWRPDDHSNSVAWLLWHVARIQDDHVAALSTAEQQWTSGGWARRFGMDDGMDDTGYGHTPEQVAAIQPGSSTLLVDYLTVVTDQTLALLESIEPDDLDRVVDDSWDPPVTMGVRLNSVISDNLQHLGQAAQVQGLWKRA